MFGTVTVFFAVLSSEGKKRIYPVESPFSPFSHGLKSDIPSDQSLPSAASGIMFLKISIVLYLKMLLHS